jgi:hypothetical protein
MHLGLAGALVGTMSSKVAVPHPGADLPPRALKRLDALGHHIAAWSGALEALRGRLKKDRLPESWQAHVRAGLPEEIGPPLEAMEIHIRVPEDQAADDWWIDFESTPAMPALTAAARALLHLPALQKTWLGWLRGSVLVDLRQRLGRAWIVDPSALPCHGALPGLGLARWADFDRLANSGRRFRIAIQGGDLWTLDAGSEATEWKKVADQLADCELGGAVVEELPVRVGSLRTVAYALKEGRWQLS